MLATLDSLFYDGKLAASGSSSFRKENEPFQFSIQLEGANINKLKNNTPFKDKNLSGMLSLSLNAQGLLNHEAARLGIPNGQQWSVMPNGEVQVAAQPPAGVVVEPPPPAK